MFKIKCYESGLREIYFGKKKIFKIRNLVQGLRFMLNNISKKIDVLVLDMAESQQSKEGFIIFNIFLGEPTLRGNIMRFFMNFICKIKMVKRLFL